MQSGYLLRNRYRIEQRLSAGAFGETYIAVDENPDYPIERQVVVKHLKPQNNDPKTLEIARYLFEKEAKTLAKLGETTDRIPTLYAYFEEKSEFYLVQELIEGQTLTKELENCQLSEIETLRIVQNILTGLEKVHNSNNIHRDLKPDNIIRRAINQKLVLIDFGAVKAVRQGTNPQISQTIGIGTPGYTPGEQWRCSPQFASDIYAVGAIALKCLTGTEPYELLDKDSGEFKWRHLCQVSDRVANVLYKMVATRYLDRYTNATAAKKEIDRLLTTPIDRRKFLRSIVFASGSGIGVLILSKTPKLFNQKPVSPSLSTITIEFTSVKLNDRGVIIDRPNGEADIYKEELGNGLNLTIVKIPSGDFMMGSPEREKGSTNEERPQHKVNIQEFYIGQTLITQLQYETIMRRNPSRFRGDNLPVENVDWREAKEFCHKLSTKTGRNYSLPSESQWEYACRSGTITPFAFGNTISTDAANYSGNYTYENSPKGLYRGKTTEIATFPPNSFGLYDMHGNVWEWCEDTWHENYQDAPIDGSPWTDGNNNQDRVLRGGSWYLKPSFCRSASRSRWSVDVTSKNFGFRVLLSEL
jgi:eukaryotic-like serine/threonine-protein kinase